MWETLLSRMGATPQSLAQMTQHEDAANAALKNAIKVRPRLATLKHHQALFYLRLARVYGDVARQSQEHGNIHTAKSRGYLQQAGLSMRETVNLYPTRAILRFGLAFLLDISGGGSSAVVQYRKALRLSGLARAAGTPSLELPSYDKSAALFRTEREEEALDHLVESYRVKGKERLLALRWSPVYDPRMEEILNRAIEILDGKSE